MQKQEKWRGYGQDIKPEDLVNGKEIWSVMRWLQKRSEDQIPNVSGKVV